MSSVAMLCLWLPERAMRWISVALGRMNRTTARLSIRRQKAIYVWPLESIALAELNTWHSPTSIVYLKDLLAVYGFTNNFF